MEEGQRPTLPDLSGVTVLQVVPALETGGAERTAVDIAAAIVIAGGRALVASTGGRLVPELQDAGAEWLEFPAATKNPARIIANGERLRRLVEQENVSLLHARSRAPAWSAFLAARRSRLPFVTTYHGAYGSSGRLKNFYNSVMARGDVVIANSQFTARLIADRHPFCRERIAVIYRGTDLSAFDKSAIAEERVERLRAGWGIARGRRIVLLPARLTAWKGQEVLIDAAARLLAQGYEDVDFVLAGDHQGREGYRENLVNRMLKSGLGQRIRLVGHCSDMPAAYALADVVAIPSTAPEAFGRTAVEAQALGRPVIVSNLGAVPETVLAPPDVKDSQRTGWRVTAGDPVALAEALANALSLGIEEREALAARALRHVGIRFSLPAMIGATLGIYAQLITPHSPLRHSKS